MTKGFKEFEKYLRTVERKLDDQSRLKALMMAGKVIERKAKNKAPVRTGKMQKAIKTMRYREGEELKGDYAIAITASSRKGWYAHIVEFGSVNQKPQPFLRPAFEEGKEEALRVLAEELRKAMGLEAE